MILLHARLLANCSSDTWNQQDVVFSLTTVVIAILRIWVAQRGELPDPDVDGASMHFLAALPIDLYALLVVMNYYRVLRYLAYCTQLALIS